MQTFSNIFNGEAGSSVRGKLNKTLTSIISGREGINAIWAKINSVVQRINGMDSGISHIVKDTSYNPSSLDPDKNAILIALCTGTFSHIKDKNGTPITIPGSNALTIFYRAANTTYWEYDTQEISPTVAFTRIYDHTEVEMSISPNVLNRWGELEALTIYSFQKAQEEYVNEYMLEFTVSGNAFTLTLPEDIRWIEEPTWEDGYTYQVSIINNLAVFARWEAQINE